MRSTDGRRLFGDGGTAFGRIGIAEQRNMTEKEKKKQKAFRIKLYIAGILLMLFGMVQGWIAGCRSIELLRGVIAGLGQSQSLCFSAVLSGAVLSVLFIGSGFKFATDPSTPAERLFGKRAPMALIRIFLTALAEILLTVYTGYIGENLMLRLFFAVSGTAIMAGCSLSRDHRGEDARN